MLSFDSLRKTQCVNARPSIDNKQIWQYAFFFNMRLPCPNRFLYRAIVDKQIFIILYSVAKVPEISQKLISISFRVPV